MNADVYMRALAMFDLPVKTKEEHRNAQNFRKNLVQLGFVMLQYSVYVRILKGYEKANAIKSALVGVLPPKGNVRLLLVTESQFEKMDILIGLPKSRTEKIHAERSLFEF